MGVHVRRAHATVVVPAAVAHSDSHDDLFLALISAQGIPGPPDQLIAAGHAACDHYGSPNLVAEITGLMGQGLSSVQAQNVALDGLKAYCPENPGWVPGH
jgi:Protein of unknown function (DUF732)